MARKYHQGMFTPKHPEKYLGDPKGIVFRSGLEARFFRHFDGHPGVKRWGSEEFFIPYVSPVDNSPHRYFVDLIIETVKDEVFVIEIKPFSQCFPPKSKKNSKRFLSEQMTYEVNQAKWEAAKKFCAAKGWKFMVLTEKSLKMVRD